MKTTLLGAIALSISVSSLSAQWQQATPGASPPTTAAAAFATGPTGNLLMFGGDTGGFAPSSQAWTYDGTTWTTAASGPGGRAGAEMEYDINGGVFVMYGGLSSSFFGGPSKDETWVFDGTTWTQPVIVGTTPGGLGLHGMSHDSVHNLTIVYGGLPDSFFPIDSDKTFEWNGTGWTETAITPATNPGPLERPSMCFHAGIGKTVLFGGIDVQGSWNNTTWTYDGATHAWSALTIAGAKPAARTGAMMAYDSIRGVCVLTGGADPTDMTGQTYFSDTWEFDGTTWTQVATSITGTRLNGMMGFMPASNRMVVFGGVSFATFTYYNDTWEWETGTFGSACPGSNGLPHLSVNQSPRLGQPWVVTASNLNTTFNAGVLVFGFTQIPGGFLLDPFPGMPGCYAYITPDASVGITGSLGDASWTWPSVGGTIGSQFWGQALCYDPGVNAFDFTITQAISGTIGL
ncbi:MAG: hypothetical protein JNM25_02720 [Planctomycetes bacterium]|nr:hypothetical protein [Planctomycetota bacterium]